MQCKAIAELDGGSIPFATPRQLAPDHVPTRPRATQRPWRDSQDPVPDPLKNSLSMSSLSRPIGSLRVATTITELSHGVGRTRCTRVFCVKVLPSFMPALICPTLSLHVSHSIASQLSWCSVTRPPNRSRTLATRCARAASSSDASACPRVCRQPCGAACPVVSWPVARHSRERRRRPRARKPSLAGYTARRCWASYSTHARAHGLTDGLID